MRKGPPKEIYLVWDTDGQPTSYDDAAEHGDVCWNEDPSGEVSIPYIRADQVKRIKLED